MEPYHISQQFDWTTFSGTTSHVVRLDLLPSEPYRESPLIVMSQAYTPYMMGKGLHQACIKINDPKTLTEMGNWLLQAAEELSRSRLEAGRGGDDAEEHY